MQAIKEKIKDQLFLAPSPAVSRILEKIFNYAAAEEIDEIIFESVGEKGLVKFYDAGEDKGSLNFSETTKNLVFQALKKLAGMKGCEKNERGEFKKECIGTKILFSVTSYLFSHSEKIVINLRRDKFEVLDVASLGLEKSISGRVKEILEKSQGLVLVVGPFNSGKTSTLYSFVNHVNSPDLNVTTFEREISYDMPTVNQSRLGDKPGFRPLSLSSIVKQDPDVVMIDEIVDKDAALAALHLADHGYFVLAGVEGLNTASILSSFQGLGVSLSLFSSSVKMVVNQRLVLKNCPKCLEKQKIGAELKKRLKTYFPKPELLARLKDKKILAPEIESIEDMVFYRGQGCEACRQKGVSGRIGIFEILIMNDEAKKLIKGGHFSRVNEEVFDQEGFSLVESAFIKAAAGIISPEEVLRIAEEKG